MKNMRKAWMETRMLFAEFLLYAAVFVVPTEHPDSRALIQVAEWYVKFLKVTKETKGTKTGNFLQEETERTEGEGSQTNP